MDAQKDLDTSIKAEHVSGDSIDIDESGAVHPVLRAPTGDDYGADSDSPYPLPFDATAGTGGGHTVTDLVTGSESFNYETNSLFGTLVEDIIVFLDVHSKDQK
uniref:Uncharacterized protein n=1 Tax=Amphimedon queenslandica TaxID=400682 RepID=A0A1X7UAX1_AMPQE